MTTTPDRTTATPPGRLNGSLPPGPPDLDPPAAVASLRAALSAALRGKDEAIGHVLACLIGRSHALLEDAPGLGKTTLAKALAAAVGGRFGRVQCTPDLLPGDVTGFSVFDQAARAFEFRPGPVFADVLLVDEVNRATPRTQSALLEAMAEGQVTADDVRRPLSDVFFVVATQNPVEHGGTYPLPEAQLDRFGLKLSLGYPSPEHELAMLADAAGGPSEGVAEAPPPVLDPASLRALQRRSAAVAVGEPVRRYLVALGAATREHPRVSLGVSPRGLLTWQRIAQARALMLGRSFATPDDVQDVAGPVLSVRLGVASGDPAEAAEVIRDLLDAVPVPSGAGAVVTGRGR